MGKQNKLKNKLLDHHRSFTWQELSSLLKILGYQEIQGNGSRVKFDNGNPDDLINLHRPHPGNEMKRYVVRQIIEKLKQANLI